MDGEPWPTELRLRPDKQALLAAFDDGARYELPAELLRVESPSAEVQGHSPAEKKLVSGKRRVRIVSVEPIGNYAIKIRFDDGHATGIYSWSYLRDLGERAEALTEAYAAQLAERGLTRD